MNLDSSTSTDTSDDGVFDYTDEKHPEFSYYKQIDKKKYDKKLLSNALKFMAEDKNLQINEEKMRYLCNSTKDGGKITECEIDTLQYIRCKYDLTSGAKLLCLSFLRKLN